MNSELLDTAVKLAALGTSGVCVAALVWTGLFMARMPAEQERNKHASLRNYMLMCFGIAIVSGVSGAFSPTAERSRELQATNQAQAEKIAAFDKAEHERDARNELIREQVRAVVKLAKVNSIICASVGPYLDKILELLGPEKSAVAAK
ncbi:MAG: hypothetical protein K8U57_34975 [Planctomycetes bacterium]|nr:hypothetical protein [Planctomycetota bacterium]